MISYVCLHVRARTPHVYISNIIETITITIRNVLCPGKGERKSIVPKWISRNNLWVTHGLYISGDSSQTEMNRKAKKNYKNNKNVESKKNQRFYIRPIQYLVWRMKSQMKYLAMLLNKTQAIPR